MNTNTTVHVPTKWGVYSRAATAVLGAIFAGLVASLSDNNITWQEAASICGGAVLAFRTWQDQSLSNYTAVTTGEVQANRIDDGEASTTVDATEKNNE